MTYRIPVYETVHQRKPGFRLMNFFVLWYMFWGNNIMSICEKKIEKKEFDKKLLASNHSDKSVTKAISDKKHDWTPESKSFKVSIYNRLTTNNASQGDKRHTKKIWEWWRWSTWCHSVECRNCSQFFFQWNFAGGLINWIKRSDQSN